MLNDPNDAEVTKPRSGNIRLLQGGYAVALVATAIALGATLVLRRDGGSLRVDRIEALEIIGFVIVSATITGLMKALQRARTLAESRAAELKKLNDEVGRSYNDERERRRTAELMAQAREEVLAVVAHDLRNPLNIIVSAADLLVQERLDRVKKKQLLLVMLRAGKQMNRLIADLLDTVRLQAGKFTLDVEEVPVRTIFAQTEEAFRPLAANRSISLLAVPPSDDVAVRADPFRVSQIIGNLVGNALKFTPEQGTVTLRASQNGHNVAFHVSDTGPGIPPSDVEHLFDNFWQARNDHRGVGLGLPIAKGMVEAHGGMIWCETRPGQGATFSFTLPRSDAA